MGTFLELLVVWPVLANSGQMMASLLMYARALHYVHDGTATLTGQGGIFPVPYAEDRRVWRPCMCSRAQGSESSVCYRDLEECQDRFSRLETGVDGGTRLMGEHVVCGE